MNSINIDSCFSLEILFFNLDASLLMKLENHIYSLPNLFTQCYSPFCLYKIILRVIKKNKVININDLNEVKFLNLTLKSLGWT